MCTKSSRILFFGALCVTMVSFFGIIECSLIMPTNKFIDEFDESYDNGLKNSQENRSSANSNPTFDKKCNGVPYHGCDPDSCEIVAINFGKRAKDDSRVLKKIYEKPKKSNSPVIVRVKYPEPNTSNICPINMIKVENADNGKSLGSDEADIEEGGINYDHVELRIKSQNVRSGGYKVSIFVDCTKKD